MLASDTMYSCSGQLMEEVRKLDYKGQYKVCEEFYHILKEEESCDDIVMCGRFRESYEMVEPHYRRVLSFLYTGQ